MISIILDNEMLSASVISGTNLGNQSEIKSNEVNGSKLHRDDNFSTEYVKNQPTLNCLSEVL